MFRAQRLIVKVFPAASQFPAASREESPVLRWLKAPYLPCYQFLLFVTHCVYHLYIFASCSFMCTTITMQQVGIEHKACLDCFSHYGYIPKVHLIIPHFALLTICPINRFFCFLIYLKQYVFILC